jgi:HEAT repeat protein
MDDEEIHEHLAYLDGRSSENMHEAIAKLEASGVDIPGLMIKKYKISRRWADRASCVYHCMKYARTHEDAYELGIIALQDKSRAVRHRACMLLSATGRKEAIGHLEELLSDETSRNEALAVIDLLLNLKQT